MKADKKQNLLESDDEEEVAAKSKSVRFSINTKYAKDYQRRKQNEELRKEKESGRFLDDDEDDDDSSESSSEDEDAELLTTKLDTDILKTINAVRQKDKSIYDPETRFFPASDEGSEDEEEKVETKKRKPKRMKDVLREQILEQMDGEKNKENKNEERTSRLAYDEQQQQLRKAFIDSTNPDDSGDDDDTDDGDLLVVKRKIQGESDNETSKKFQEELLRMEKSVLSSKGGGSLVDPRGEVEDGEKFLLDYFKNKTWIEKDFDVGEDDDDDDDDNYASASGSKPSKLRDNDDEDSLDDLEKADDFEAKYNFRFEEAAAEAASSSGAAHSLIGFARGQTMNTLRRNDDSRKEKRLARKERKAAERRAKEEKLKRLKNAKRQQMEEKMKQVRGVLGKLEAEGADSNASGADEAAIMKLLEGDFDPDNFQAQMQEAFGDEFYTKEDAEWKTDEDVEEALMNDEQYKELIGRDDEETDGAHEENAENAEQEEEGKETDHHDQAYDGSAYDEDQMEEDGESPEHEETDLEKKMRLRMMDKLYELDYEDIVAGMPTRFKYRQVEKNDFGLSAHEILLAKDSTLKQLVSLKKLAPYREKEEHRVSNNKRRRFREMLEQDIAEMEEKMKEEGVTLDMNSAQFEEGKKKKRRRLKKNKTENKADDDAEESKETSETPDDVLEVPENTDNPPQEEEASKKRRRKKKGKKKSKSDPMEQEEQNTGVPIENARKEKPSADEIAKTREVSEDDKNETIKAKKRKKKKNKKGIKVEGISQARLAAYDL